MFCFILTPIVVPIRVIDLTAKKAPPEITTKKRYVEDQTASTALYLFVLGIAMIFMMNMQSPDTDGFMNSLDRPVGSLNSRHIKLDNLWAIRCSALILHWSYFRRDWKMLHVRRLAASRRNIFSSCSYC